MGLWYDDLIATLIITIIFGLIIAFFAIQNTGDITIHFLSYTIPGIPTYVLIIGVLLLGLLFSWLLSMIKGIGTSFTMHGKDGKIKAGTKENEELKKKIQQLEIDNAKLVTAANLPANF